MSSPAATPAALTPSPPAAVLHTETWTVRADDTPAHLEAQLAPAAAALARDELVAFPTETVYGLASNARSASALRAIYTAKGRPSDNPLIVHVHSHAQFLSLGRDIPQLALQLVKAFWPGPLTVIVPTAYGPEAACETARAGLDCVGVRMPNHPVALALLRACNLPLAAPSANLSGRPSPTTAAHVAADLTGRIAGIVDGGDAGVGLESTVVECQDPKDGEERGWITILRPGGITREQLETIVGVGRVRLDPAIEVDATREMNGGRREGEPVKALPKQTKGRSKEVASVESLMAASASPPASSAAAAASSAASSSPSPVPAASPGPKAPGMKYTHYAPRAPLLLVDGSIDFLLAQAWSYAEKGDVVGILATQEHAEAIARWRVAKGLDATAVHFVPCGHRADLGSVAHQLYSSLRAFDDTPVQIIFSEVFSQAGVGEAIMNRLNKAAGGQCIKEEKKEREHDQ